MTDGGERVNLIFDLVLPREGEFDKEKIRKEVVEEIHRINEKYYAVITVEHSYV